MNENSFTELTEELKRGIDNEISYIYSCFVPEGTDDVLAVMKGNIAIADREFLDSATRISVGNGWTCPYELMISRVKRQIEDFYAEIDLSSQSVLKLSEYGDRADVFKKTFAENLKKSEETTKKQILRELELMVMQGTDVKTLLRQVNISIDKRADALKTLLVESAGQMERYMVLWDYQDAGYTEYRFTTIGDNCEQCNEAGGNVFKIDSATVGNNLPPLHPNCNCKAEILDKYGNAVATLQANDDNDKKLDYFKTSLKQIILGNYTEDSNLLGTLGQIALGFLGVDLPADIRDLMYDITNWKLTPSHALQTILDAAALLPVIGSIKYTDEAVDVVKGVLKRGDDVVNKLNYEKITDPKLLWDSWRNYEKVDQNGQIYAKIGDRLYTEHAVNRMQPSGNRFGPNIYQGLNGKDYGRSISPQYIEEIIQTTKPVFQKETGNYVHALGTVKVIVNGFGNVVTVITYQ